MKKIFKPEDQIDREFMARQAALEMLDALEKLEAMYFDFSRESFDLVEIRKIITAALAFARAK